MEFCCESSMGIAVGKTKMQAQPSFFRAGWQLCNRSARSFM